MAALGIGMDDIGIAHIDNAAALTPQIDAVILMIIGPCMAECEQGGRLADTAWPKTSPRTPLGAAIKRCAQNGNIRINSRPVCLDRVFSKTANADKRQVNLPLSYPLALMRPSLPR